MMLQEMLHGGAIFLLYFIIALAVLVPVRLLVRMPREIFRKALHIVCVCSIFILLHAFASWQAAMLFSLVFAVLLYPLIRWLGRFPRVMEVLVQRGPGELSFSLMLAYCMFAALIAVFWGLLGEAWKFVIPVSVMTWGLGDAAAALIGKAFGRHPVPFRFTRGRKTREGSLAMFAFSVLAIFVSMRGYTQFGWPLCLGAALIGAAVATVAEAASDGRWDTLTVPVSTAISVFLMVGALG